MYHLSVGTHLGHDKYVYTKLCKISKKYKITDFNSPRNEPLNALEYCSKNIEEYFHLRNPDKINLSDESITQDVKTVMNIMVKHVNYMEQGMIGLQYKLIESDNERVNQQICIYQPIGEKNSTKMCGVNNTCVQNLVYMSRKSKLNHRETDDQEPQHLRTKYTQTKIR